jgi:membrane protein
LPLSQAVIDDGKWLMSADLSDSPAYIYDRPVIRPPDPFGRGELYDETWDDSPEAARLGRLAETPLDIPWSGWKRVLRRTGREIISDRVSLVAAGCAFYGMLALFPAISMLVSIYGLVFDPVSVEPHLLVLQGLLPPTAFGLIENRVHELVSRHQTTLTLSLGLSFMITLWSAATGTKSMLTALNLAYEERERRSFLHFQVTAFTMTLVALLGAAAGLGMLVGLPVALTFMGVTDSMSTTVEVASLSGLLVFVVSALSLLYRFGPSRASPRWVWVAPGAVLATGLWLVTSVLFSFYVGHLSSYDAMYGSIGAVVGVMMWFYVTVYVVLLGAELNAELELQTARDSTGGAPKPIGQRGAYVADHVARN